MSIKKMEQVNELMNEFLSVLEVDAVMTKGTLPDVERIINEYIRIFEDLKIEILRAID